jgi:hypothetical protein
MHDKKRLKDKRSMEKKREKGKIIEKISWEK